MATKYCVVRFSKKGKPKLTWLSDGPRDKQWTEDKALAEYTVEYMSGCFPAATYTMIGVQYYD